MIIFHIGPTHLQRVSPSLGESPWRTGPPYLPILSYKPMLTPSCVSYSLRMRPFQTRSCSTSAAAVPVGAAAAVAGWAAAEAVHRQTSTCMQVRARAPSQSLANTCTATYGSKSSQLGESRSVGPGQRCPNSKRAPGLHCRLDWDHGLHLCFLLAIWLSWGRGRIQNGRNHAPGNLIPFWNFDWP